MVFDKGRDREEEQLEENEVVDEHEDIDKEEDTREDVEVMDEDVENSRDGKGAGDSDLNEELSARESEIEELTSRLLRLQADYSNYKRRTEIEKKGSIDFGIETLAIELLPVIDNFERALDAEEDKESSFYQGITMIYQQLIDTLKKLGIEEIDALNNPFDPNSHNAVMVEESEEHEEGIVIGILQKGYQFKDKVIRPAMVKVSK
ncbi:MAG: nucleotide exchange factor GrpE [Tissierellaceae bacterium]|jgi:molecular chaperone GrpE|nr:nucleotide exchange factor GrpE [Tissierellia bacterium]